VDRPSIAALLLPCLLLPWAGCTLTALDPAECEDGAECRAAFGPGSVCGDDGRCSAPRLHPRCTRAWPPTLLTAPEQHRDTLVIGSVFAYEEHADTQRAAELAIRQVADQGGLDGRMFGIVHCDSTAMAGDQLDDIAGAADAARFLATAMGVPAIVGPRGSSRTEAVFEAVREHGTLVISPSATSPSLTGLEAADPTFDAPGLLWRTVPPDTLQSKVIIADMRARGVERVAVLYQAGAYGEGLATLFEAGFLAAGGGLVDRQSFASGQFATQVATVGDALATGELDEVLFVSSDIADSIGFLIAASATDDLLAAYGSETIGIFLTDAAFNIALIEDTVGRAATLFPRIRGTRPAPAEGVLFNAFAAAYAAQFDANADSSGFTPHAYDATWLVLYGIARASHAEPSIDGTGIARGLRSVSEGPAVDILPTSWPTAVAQLRMGGSIDVRGASGPLDYDPATEETIAPISVWAIEPDGGAPSGWDFVELERVEPDG
jgi:branched-chain amino acid transport system substrate-binding protein